MTHRRRIGLRDVGLDSNQPMWEPACSGPASDRSKAVTERLRMASTLSSNTASHAEHRRRSGVSSGSFEIPRTLGSAGYHADRRSAPHRRSLQMNTRKAVITAFIAERCGLFVSPAMACETSGPPLSPPLHDAQTTPPGGPPDVLPEARRRCPTNDAQWRSTTQPKQNPRPEGSPQQHL